MTSKKTLWIFIALTISVGCRFDMEIVVGTFGCACIFYLNRRENLSQIINRDGNCIAEYFFLISLRSSERIVRAPAYVWPSKHLISAPFFQLINVAAVPWLLLNNLSSETTCSGFIVSKLKGMKERQKVCSTALWTSNWTQRNVWKFVNEMEAMKLYDPQVQNELLARQLSFENDPSW